MIVASHTHPTRHFCLKGRGATVVLNIASDEYFKVIDKKALMESNLKLVKLHFSTGGKSPALYGKQGLCQGGWGTRLRYFLSYTVPVFLKLGAW